MNPLLQQLIGGLPAREMPASSPLAPARPAVQKLRYSHEAMIDILISEPWISQNEIADRFGMSASWISTIICSDLFQSRLAARRDQLVDPDIRASLKTQFEGLLSRSLEILRHKLNDTPDRIPDQLAVQVAKMSGQSLGYGVREARVSVQETHVHLEELGNNLVSLLRRRKAEVYDNEATSHEDLHQGNSQQLQSRPSEGAGTSQQARQLGVPAADVGLQAGNLGQSRVGASVPGGRSAPADGQLRDPPASEVR